MNLSDLAPRPGCHCIVVGAGPSAPKYYDKIDTTQMVIAPSTMLLPLQKAGIYPDVTCVMDPSAIMPLHFKGVDSSKTLVYMPSVPQKCYREWNGPKHIVTEPVGSVLLMCIRVALHLGAAEITLVGADFCYGAERKSHAAGVVTSYPISDRHPLVVKNGRGEDVQTEPSLIEYAANLETVVAEHKDIRWRRMGTDGIPIQGVTND